MHYIIYLSSASQKFNQDEIQNLITLSQANNRNQGITGLLIHRDGNFIQYLEGEEKPVRELYEKIKKDVRHSDITIVDEGVTQKRIFLDWNMNLRQYRGDPLFTASELARDEQGVLPLIESFIKNMR